MRKWIIGAFITAIALMITPIIESRAKTMDENVQMRGAIVREMQNTKSIDFKTLADGEWDRLVIIGPYTEKSIAEKKAGASLARIEHYDMHFADNKNLLVFCKGSKLEGYVYLGRDLVNFEPEDMLKSISKKDSIFSIREKEDTYFASMKPTKR